jgi:hypothetical protein
MIKDFCVTRPPIMTVFVALTALIMVNDQSQVYAQIAGSDALDNTNIA